MKAEITFKNAKPGPLSIIVMTLSALVLIMAALLTQHLFSYMMLVVFMPVLALYIWTTLPNARYIKLTRNKLIVKKMLSKTEITWGHIDYAAIFTTVDGLPMRNGESTSEAGIKFHKSYRNFYRIKRSLIYDEFDLWLPIVEASTRKVVTTINYFNEKYGK